MTIGDWEVLLCSGSGFIFAFMDLPSKKVFSVLQANRVEYLYHANSVITSCQFLRNGALLSRGSVARKRLYQTPQKSDDDDKAFGLWFDVFTDSVDIHKRASQANFYGPVLFVIRLADLGYTGRIWVTKLNPIKWEGKPRHDKWFSSVQELQNEFSAGRFDEMVVFRHCGGELPIKKCLAKIILDDPRLETSKRRIDYFSMAYGALKLAMTEGKIDVPIEKRRCSGGCKCERYYERGKTTTEMFFPKLK